MDEIERVSRLIEEEIYRGFKFSRKGIKQTITIQAIASDAAYRIINNEKSTYIRSTPYETCHGCGELVIYPRLTLTEEGKFCKRCLDE